jgi:hypothetical protein
MIIPLITTTITTLPTQTLVAGLVQHFHLLGIALLVT